MVSTYPPQSHMSDPVPQMERVESLDLISVLGGVWARKRLIIGISLAVTLCAFAFVWSAVPKYTSEARVIIANAETSFTRVGENTLRQPLPDTQAVRSQEQVLLSRDLALRVIKKLNLLKNEGFQQTKRPGFSLSDVLQVFGLGASKRAKKQEQRVLDSYFRKLEVYTVPLSRVLAIKFTTEDPEMAKKLANTLADIYIRSTREAKLEATQHASKWLSERAAKLRRELDIAEQAVEEFRADAGLVRGRDGNTLSAQAISELNSQISVAAAAKSNAENRAREVRSLLRKRNGIASASEVLDSVLIQRLAEQRAGLQRQAADLSASYFPSHPRMVRIRAEIGGLDRQIRAEIRKVATSLQDQARSAGTREKSLRRTLAQMKSRIMVDNKEQVKLKALEREAKAKRELLESFLRRLRDAATRQDIESQSPGARIISHARASTSPSYPKKGPILVLAALGSVILGVTIAFLIEIFSFKPQFATQPAGMPQPDKPKRSGLFRRNAPGQEGSVAEAAPMNAAEHPNVAATPQPEMPQAAPAPAVQEPAPQPAPAVTQAPAVAPAPHPAAVVAPVQPQVSSVQPQMVAAAAPAVAAAPEVVPIIGQLSPAYLGAQQPLGADPNVFGPIATALVNNKSASRANRILITADHAVQGDNAAVIDLARAMSADHTVLLVDADLLNPGIAKSLGLDNGPGLADLLQDTASFSDVIISDKSSSGHIMRAGRGPMQARAHLSSQQMNTLLDALGEAYDFVLINTGPVGEFSDVQALGSKADSTLIFANNDASGREPANILRAVGQHNIGLILRNNA